MTCQRVRGETLDNGDLVELSREIVSENRPKSPVAAECASVYDKLSIIDSVIIHNSRIVIPKSSGPAVLENVHAGHQVLLL